MVKKKIFILTCSMLKCLAKVRVGCKTDMFHWIISGSRIRLSDDRVIGRIDG